MAISKNKPSKTINPLHFEDLEPHRFEDLVRQLIYDFRDWQSIEATGRAGSDEGFDIRAWEKLREITNQDEEDKDDVGRHPMEGNLWMVQCKREQVIGPTKIANILSEIDSDNPPYGYILVAPANFSKKSYDVFRNTLREKGVLEFYLWGKSELEDQLSLPKNDRILFTFFGISLIVRRRSKSSEYKFRINNKNKLLRILSDGEHTQNIRKSILLRDIKDENYPWKDEYSDFDKNPRWVEHIAFRFHPRGLLFHVREFYAYIDRVKKEFDYTETVDLIKRQSDRKDRDPNYQEQRNKVLDYWQHLPRKNQAKYAIDRLVSFDDMLVIDGKGDIMNDFPHIFVDFHPENGPFRGQWGRLKIGKENIDPLSEEYKRIKVFPKEFPEIKKGKVYKDKTVEWDEETLRLFEVSHDRINTLYDVDGKYNFLKVRDVILISGIQFSGENVYIEITHKYKTTVKEYITERGGFNPRESIERQVGREVEDEEKLDVYEFERTYEWALKT